MTKAIDLAKLCGITYYLTPEGTTEMHGTDRQIEAFANAIREAVLAESQAREKVLYSAANALLTELEDNLAVNHWSANMTTALAALEQKTDDTALKAALANEREADRRKCIDIIRFELGATGQAEAICLAIRALENE